MTAPAGTDRRTVAPPTADHRSRWGDRLGVLIPAVLAYVPLLLTQPGQVGADTKTYLYLDPARLLSDAPYLWDSGIGAGTITHQNIGYLWPMGPFYWLLDTVGLPDWLAQRLWLGTVMFAAAMGVRYLLRTLGWRDSGVLVASLAYMLSPYLLDYSARISVILLPWAGLGWLIAFSAKSIRHGGWRWPALFALTVLTVGGINATALLMIAPGPALWFVWAVWVEREASLRQAAAALGRLAALTLATSLWWMAGLWAQGRYGLPVLRYTESYQTVAEASTAPEVLRGLGYWFFYGRDKLGPWIEPNVEYTSRTLLLGLSYAIPVLALAGAAVSRWRHRSFFLALVVVGALMSIGAHPWDDSSPMGWLFKMFTRTDAGLALRSTPRALPLVVLGLAVALGAGVSALGRRIPRMALPAAALVCLLVVVNLPPLWNGTMIADNLKRPEDVPTYWTDAADHLQAGDHLTRVLEIPGTEFASYRWGNTVDPITPGLIDRPYVARELFAYGTPASQALLIALDRRLHEDSFDPDALTPMARLLSAGDVVLRSDLQFERYRTARPRPTWELLLAVPGLGRPATFGAPEPNLADPEQPLVDEVTLALPLDLEDPPPVAVFPVEDPLSIIRAENAARPLTMAGGPEGVVDAAGTGVLERAQPLFYSATFWDDPDALDELLADGADLLVTDTNRKQARRWGALQQNTGYTERADEEIDYDPTDNRLEIFPGAPSDAYTVSEQRGDAIVTATDYGNPVTYTADDRPANALDGDIETAWRVGAFSDVRGERLIIELDEPVTTDHVTVVQPTTGIVNRVITSGRLHFDGETGETFGLTPESEEAPGQALTFPERTFQRLEIEVLETNIGRRTRYDGVSAVGFAEVDVGGARIEEVIRPPTDLLEAAGAGSLDHRLAYLFTRLRSNPSEPVRLDEEVAMRRVLDLPTDRSLALDASARLSAYAPDDLVDELVGLPSAAEGGVTATSDARLPGSPANRASAALDGDPATFWSPPFEKQPGHWIDVTFAEPVTFDHLDLELLADGRHSVPTRLFLRPDGNDDDVTVVDLEPIDDRDEPNATVDQSVEFEPITATTLRVAVDGVRDVETIDWHSGLDIVMPIAIAELGIPGVRVTAPEAAFDSGCRDDLLSIDDRGVPVRVTGTTAEALDLEPLAVDLCRLDGDRADGDPMTDGLAVTAGEHVLRTGTGRDLGLDIDQLLLASDAGGRASGDPSAGAPRPASPVVEVTDQGRVSATVDVSDADEPYWLVLGQSHSDGWTATIDGGASLGTPTLIDGYANGWRIDPAEVGSDVTVKLSWTPQRVIWAGLGASAVGIVVCLSLLVLGRRREHPSDVVTADPPQMAWPPFDIPGPTFSTAGAVAAALGLGLFAALNSPPLPLLVPVVSLVAYTAFRWSRGRTLQAWLAAATMAATGLFYVVSQVLFRHPPDFIWPQQFGPVHVLGLLVIFLLAGDCVRAALVTRRGGTGPTIEAGGDGSEEGVDRPADTPAPAPRVDEEPT